MEQRFKLKEVQPEAYKGMFELEKYLGTTGIAPLHKELIKIRASQLNGCAYCLNLHTKDARKMGETEQRIYLLNAWRESPQFSEEERVILELTEEITLIHQHGLSDEVYKKAIALFGEAKTGQLIMAVVTINAWNRLGVSQRLQPE
ncbi:carboxymuconolactone decarboxylase family protein [Flavitalea flava]